jgi:hypothetical protein
MNSKSAQVNRLNWSETFKNEKINLHPDKPDYPSGNLLEDRYSWAYEGFK